MCAVVISTISAVGDMLASVVVVQMAALAECYKIAALVVGTVSIEVRYGEHDLDEPIGLCLLRVNAHHAEKHREPVNRPQKSLPIHTNRDELVRFLVAQYPLAIGRAAPLAFPVRLVTHLLADGGPV